MRDLTTAELTEIKEALFNGRQWSVEVEDFNMAEFNAQLAKVDQDDAELQAVEVGRRPASAPEGRVASGKLEVRE